MDAQHRWTKQVEIRRAASPTQVSNSLGVKAEVRTGCQLTLGLRRTPGWCASADAANSAQGVRREAQDSRMTFNSAKAERQQVRARGQLVGLRLNPGRYSGTG